MKFKFNRIFKNLGPGLITGAADDDPSGVATYSQTGAQFGLGLLWTTIFLYPLMTAVQEACARIGAVTGKGIAATIRKHYSKKILFPIVSLVILANTINIGADLGAMASAIQLLIPLHFAIIVIFFTILVLVLEIFTSYETYSKVLKWLALTILSYPLTLFVINADWKEILLATITPSLSFNFSFLYLVTGVIGTTISPYMFFWQASEEVEEEKEENRIKPGGTPRLSHQFLRKIREDNAIGMLASQIATWSIIIVAATVLNKNGITDVKDAADAAKALEPLVASFPNAGFLAKLLFSFGIVGLGLLAVPVLAGSASYALSESFHWKEGLYLKLKQAHGFYGVITISTLFGLLINFIGIDPIKALIFTAVFNGIASIPLLFLIAKISSNGKIMGENKSGRLSKTLIWTTFLAILISVVSLAITLNK